jgi:hypothetical protein
MLSVFQGRLLFLHNLFKFLSTQFAPFVPSYAEDFRKLHDLKIGAREEWVGDESLCGKIQFSVP